MDESAKESNSVSAESTDIQNYLNSFNKEIEDGGSTHNDLSKQEDCFVIAAGLPNDQAKLQYVTDNEGILAGTAFFAGPDGTLYSTTAGQGDLGGAQIAFLTPGGGTFPDGSGGMQQILLAIGDGGGGLTSIDPKNLSFTVPVQLSSQIPGLKTNLVPDEAVENSDSPESEKQLKKIKISEESSVSASTSVDETSSPSAEDIKPQAIMLVQPQQGQDAVSQLVPINTSGQTLIAGLGGELQITDQQAFQLVANIGEQASNSRNSGVPSTSSPYQTVTLVPSETNSGELSYVLFMTPPKETSEKSNAKGVDAEEDNDENVDLSVYDFPDTEKTTKDYLTVQDEEGTIRTIRVNHKKSQVVTQQHMCNYCNYTSSKRYLLSRHMKSHSDERPHKCSVCERGFKTLASLQNHVNTHTGTRPHACKDCNSCFTTSGELVRHVRYKHTHEKPHHCTECGYASVELSKLKRHMRCHTGERPYQCPHCTYASPDTYKLKRHLRIHTGEKPYGCDICCARFTQSNSLKAHKLIHSGNKPVFQCEYCPATCGRKTDLRIHIQKLHSCDKLHKCKRCGKIFNDRYNFKLHTKSHEGEKCFKCDLCPYASVTLRHLEAHMLIHTDQKPFECDHCHLSFRQKQLLKRHVNLYHNPDYVPPEPKEKNLVCSECDKAFRHKGNLIRHFAIHDPDATPAEREEAMRIGEPKEPGEARDGEEDEEEEEDTSDYATVDYGTDANKQLVVFEVIQLPENAQSSEMQTEMTAVDGSTVEYDGEKQAFKIIKVPVSVEEAKNDGITFCELSNAECMSTSAMETDVKDTVNGDVEVVEEYTKEQLSQNEETSLTDLHSNSSTEGLSSDEVEQNSMEQLSQDSGDIENVIAIKSKAQPFANSSSFIDSEQLNQSGQNVQESTEFNGSHEDKA